MMPLDLPFPLRIRALAPILAVCATLWTGCARLEGTAPAEPIPEVRPGILAGYLSPEALPDPVAFLPPPPAPGSAAQALDEEESRKTLRLRGTPRWELAAADAELLFPGAAGTFSCALGAPIDEEGTPSLYRLLRRTIADAGFATYGAKKRYERKRPFLLNGEPTCAPEQEEFLSTDGSYPSGHAAIGWAWSLILAELAPDRASELLARGRAYAESRQVCNVHWKSDVSAGRTVGSAAVAILRTDPVFRADLAAARAELEDVRGRGLPPSRDCAAERAALDAS